MKRIFLTVGCILFLNTVSTASSLDSGLIAYYPFNGNANDESGNGNHGTNSGAVLTTDRWGRANKAYSFNSTYITVPNSSSLQSPTTSITIAFWTNISQWDNNMAGFFAKSNSASLGQYGSIASTTPYIQFDLGGQYVRITRFFATNTWYFICLQWDGQKARLFLNGTVYDSANFSGTLTPDTNPLILGKHTPGTTRYLKGKLDDIRIYKRALTASEIQKLYEEMNLELTVVPQGFYKPSSQSMQMKDTMRVYIRQAFFPYQILDSSKAVVDSISLRGNFPVLLPYGVYYVSLKHRNSIETWSSSSVYIEEYTQYDFTTTPSQAYGNNLVLNGNKYCLYSGDENQDGEIDVSDLVEIYNASIIFSSGYVRTDINGDGFTDVSDIIITYNNSKNLVSSITPFTPQPPCNLTFNRTFNWSGFTWHIVSSNDTRCGPGPNYFSSSTDNVWIDGSGDLHLKITNRNGKFYCAEMFTSEAVGYGLYTFYLSSHVENLDKNIVFGLFTWNDVNCITNANSELDIEFTKWGYANETNILNYSVQPTNSGQETDRFITAPIQLNSNNSIHFFNWTPSLISFSSYQGHTNPPPPENLITSWSFGLNHTPKSKEECNSNPIIIPAPENNTTLNMNLWLDRGNYPSNNQEAEVIVHQVSYNP